jgi:VanZ family protein
MAYIVVIFVGSSIPGLTSPGPEFFFKDKLAHFIEYFIMGVLLFRGIGWEAGGVRWVMFGFLFSVAATIGAVDEIYQSYIPGRDMNTTDWLADMAGAAVGIAVAMFVSVWPSVAKRAWGSGEGG